MSVEIRVPQLPESVADATLVAWRKQPGEAVSRDENLADLETDKVVLEVPSPVAGVMQEIRVAPGSSVKSGELLAIITAGAAVAEKAVAAKAVAATKLGPAATRVVEELKIPTTTIAAAAKGGQIGRAHV